MLPCEQASTYVPPLQFLFLPSLSDHFHTQFSLIMHSKGLPSVAEIRAATIELSNKNALKKVFKVQDDLVVKYGEAVKPREAETLQFFTENSSVRVPHVHGSFTNPNTKEHFIIMDFTPGQTLKHLLPTLTEGEKAEITTQMKETLTELRRIPNQGYIGGVGRTPIPHNTFCTPGGPDPNIAGPFASETVFNEGFLRRLAIVQRMAPPYQDLLQQLFAETLTNHRIVFLHSDLQPRILWCSVAVSITAMTRERRQARII
jgi:hypothetical protein